MPGKIVSRAQQGYLAVHNPKVLHELSGGHIAKGLPYHVKDRGGGKFGKMRSALASKRRAY